MTRDPITVVLADDHPLVLRALTSLISDHPAFRLLESHTDGGDALAAIRRLRPDLAVVDLKMPGTDGIGIIQGIRDAGIPTRSVLLTAEFRDAEAVNAFHAGAAAIILKSAAPESLLDAMVRTAAGEIVEHTPPVAAALDREQERRAAAERSMAILTGREREVALLALENMPNKLIAWRLGIAEGTVKIHLNNIYAKLGVTNRGELARIIRHAPPIASPGGKGPWTPLP